MTIARSPWWLLAACAAPPLPEVPPPPDVPCITFDVGTLAFGEVPYGVDPDDQVLTLANPCGRSLDVRSVELVDKGDSAIFFIVDALALPRTIEPGTELAVVVRAEPDGYGRFTDVLEVHSTDPSTPMESAALLLDSVCESVAADEDRDGDGVPDACDVCEGFSDEGRDGDGDGVPDQCDACQGADDADDADDDTVPGRLRCVSRLRRPPRRR